MNKLLLFEPNSSKNQLINEKNVLYDLKPYALKAEITYSLDSNHILIINLDAELLGDKAKYIPYKGFIKTLANNREDYWVISNIDKSLDEIELSCRHIVTEYMLSTFIVDSKPRLQNASQMIEHFRVNSQSYLEDKKFAKDLETYSNLNSEVYKNMNSWHKNYYETVNDMQELFGGEIRKEGFEVGLVDFVGSQEPIYKIEYGKNLISNTTEEDLNVTIGVLAKGYDKLYADNIIYSSKVKGNKDYLGQVVEMEYPIRMIEYDENGEKEELDPAYQYYEDEAQAKKELERLAELEFSVNRIDDPKVTFDTKFLDLSLVEECKDESKTYLNIGDKVLTLIPRFNIVTETRIINMVVDVLGDEVIDISLSNNNLKDLKPPTFNSLKQEIIKTENKFQSKLEDEVNGLESNIEQTTEKILLEVKNNKEELNSKIEQTAKDITLEVNNAKKNLQSQITINAEAITQKVSNNEFESYKEQTAEQISQKVTKGTEFNTEFKQTAKDFNFQIGKEGMNVNINKDALDVHGGAINIWNRDNTKKMIYLGSDGNAVFGGDIKLELANNPSKYVEFKAVPYSTDIGCKLVLGGSSLNNSFSVEDKNTVKYFWINYQGTYVSNNLYIVSDQRDTDPIATNVALDDGLVYPEYDNKGKLGLSNKRWNEANIVTGRFYNAEVTNALWTKEINTNNSRINMGSGNLICGSANVNGKLSCGDLKADDVKCNDVTATSLSVGSKYVVVANGSLSSNQVYGLAVRSGGDTGQYLEIQTRNSSVYGVGINPSDISLKEDVTETKVKAIDVISQIDHYSYKFKDKKYGTGADCGYIAQELEKVNKEFTYEVKQEDDSSILYPNYNVMIPYITKAIKEQQEEIEKEKIYIENIIEENRELKGRINYLELMIKDLMKINNLNI